jgi:serine/threonine-protein phosphatase 2A regulatory subunit B''
MDEDGDGILSSYELEEYWRDQMTQQLSYNNDTFGKETSSSDDEEDLIRFDDILRQMNDLIQPEQPGQFRLRDLKRNGYLAERFFDTFLHFNKFQLHESHQGCLRLKLQLELDKIRSAMTSLDQRSFLHKAEGFEDIHFGYLMFR